ncbi:purine nucleoside phosphorylase-like [Watersipora subatra]|uniref:purine nucleoside phosphorylase-like n=1 Tax=Watersipora subatra TaxID=2589382 RepID=UPI00355B922F
MSHTGHYTYAEVEKIAEYLLEKAPGKWKIGIVCGTGLGSLADTLENANSFDYEDIPNFPVSTVPGHAGKLVFGHIGGKSVVCMKGRFHMYEGYPASTVTLPIRVMKLLGVEVLLVTNAAGAVNKSYKTGDLMMLKDHIFLPGLAGSNPLVGTNDERFGPRFPASSVIYQPSFRKLARQAATELGLEKYLHEGVYGMNGGPSFESIAECGLFLKLGADVLGMSTCPETVVASHCGIQVFGMSLVTNECVVDYESEKSANHAEVLEAGDARSKDVQNFIIKLVGLLPVS